MLMARQPRRSGGAVGSFPSTSPPRCGVGGLDMHTLHLDGSCRSITAPLDVPQQTGATLLRVVPLATGDTAVIATTRATRDGREILGRLAVIAAGEGAVVRAGGVRARLSWEPVARRRPALPGEACRLCFGAVDQEAIACTCAAAFHEECHRLCITCPGCGRRPGEVAA